MHNATPSAPPATAEPVNPGGQLGKSVTFAEHDAQPQPQPQPQPPPHGPRAAIANAVVEHSNGEISASYRLFDDQGHQMAPEGQVPEESHYVPSQCDPSRPQGLAMFSIALGDIGTLPNGRNLLNRKALNHLGEYMYPEGKPLRQHDVTATVSANLEVLGRASHSSEPGESSDNGNPPVMTIDLPLDFRPLHPSLRTRRKVVVPRTPTYLEHPEAFFLTMMKRGGLEPSSFYDLLYLINNQLPQLLRYWEKMGEKRMKNGELKSPREITDDLVLFLCIASNHKVDYHHPENRPYRELQFHGAGDNFIFGRLRRTGMLPPDVAAIIDCAPTTAGHDEQDLLPGQASPSRLLAAAAQQFRRNGSMTHIYGMTYLDMTAVLYYIDRCGYSRSKPLDLTGESMKFDPDDLTEVNGITELICIIVSMCFMTDEDLGFNPLFELPLNVEPRKDLAGIRVAFDSTDGKKYVINKAISCSKSLFGPGSALYWAHKAANTRSAAKALDVSAMPRPTHTLILQSHSRPWSSTQPLYGLAEACGVGNLAEVEEAAFGPCIGDGFRYTTLEFEKNFAADVRPRMLSMRPVCMLLSSVTDPGQFKAAFISLVRAHRDLYIKAGILHRDVSPQSMVVDADNPSRGIIAGLDLAVHVTAPPSWDDEILPLGDSAFQSIDVSGLPVGKPPPEQRYRYDLESFFFLLIWSVCKIAGSVPYEARWHGMDVGQTVLSLVFGEQVEVEPVVRVYQGEMVPEGGVGEWRTDADMHELKTRLILLDQYALEDGDDDDDDGDDFNASRLAKAKGSLMSSLSATRLNDRMHDRMLLSSLGQLPYGFGRHWILPLQELFRDGYTSRRTWCERKAAAEAAQAAAAAAGDIGEHGHGGGRGFGSASQVGEFDGDTLDGHVTFDMFMGILEKGAVDMCKEASSLSLS